MENTWNFTPVPTNKVDMKYDIDKLLCQEMPTEYLKDRLRILKAMNNYVNPEYLVELERSENKIKCDKLNFISINSNCIEVLSRFFKNYPSRSCDYSIGGILMWADYFDYKMAIHDSTLFIKGYDNELGSYIYYFPLGPMDKNKAIALIKRDASNNNGSSIIVSNFETLGSDTNSQINDDRFIYQNWKEYIYDIEKFIHFSGKKMEKKRNHLNYFIRNYPHYTIEQIKLENIQELIEFTLKFEQGHIDSQLFKYESEQTCKVLSCYQIYPFEGILMRYNGYIIGYTLGEKIGDTFFVHIEKGDTGFQGIYQALSSHMAQFIQNEYPEVVLLNREEDMGYESLRKSKESYHPSLFINKKLQILTL